MHRKQKYSHLSGSGGKIRIISGKYRGRYIDTLPGSLSRPTSNRLRESLFSALLSLRPNFEGASVLDAFAGSGALGIEAISRGAAQAVFFDKDPRAIKLIQNNIDSFDLDGISRVICADIFRFMPSDQFGVFDLVFIDPPYACTPFRIFAFMTALKDAHLLDDSSLISYEFSEEREGEFLDELKHSEFLLCSKRLVSSSALAILSLSLD